MLELLSPGAKTKPFHEGRHNAAGLLPTGNTGAGRERTGEWVVHCINSAGEKITVLNVRRYLEYSNEIGQKIQGGSR